MILTIDVGNTSTTLGIFRNDELERTARMKTDPSGDPDRCQEVLEGLLMGEIPDGAIISSVVPRVNSALSEAIFRITGKHPLILNAKLKSNVDTSLYYGGYGMDRLADMTAAYSIYGGPVMTVDLGTCTTISVVNSNGCFVGGMIMPGIQVSLKAMHYYTAQLPSLKASEPKSAIGNNTIGCMESGAIIGTASAIDGFAARAQAQLGKKVTVVITGGLSGLVIPWCTTEVAHEPNLIMKGLYRIYQLNA